MSGVKKQSKIIIKNARVHNLKGIDVEIPRNQFVVITGLSGSGKTSLAFDTLYAEGQRRYVESLSSYARQFLGRMEKPAVDYIEGVSPAIAIEQKVTSRNPRSTVGTTTEIYDFLKLLFARIGKTISPVSGEEVKRDYPEDVQAYIEKLDEKEKLLMLAPFQLPEDRTVEEQLSIYMQQGYSRILANNELLRIDDIKGDLVANEIFLVIDRLMASREEENLSRIRDSAETAFYEGKGTCVLYVTSAKKFKSFSQHFERDGVTFIEPSIHLFSFNNPLGACPTCEGYGKIIGIDEDLVVPDRSKSVYDECVVAWKGEKMSKWKNDVIRGAGAEDFPIHRAYSDLTEEERDMLWNGTASFKGINDFFKYVEKKSYKIQYRVMLSRYRGRTTCTTCNGNRLREEAGYVLIDGQKITDLINIPITRLHDLFQNLKLSKTDAKIAKRLLVEINNRLDYLLNVGLGYLTLNRLSGSLSGGESQRINLATSLGSSLVGSMYILDEPSIGLHPKDTANLIGVLDGLKKQGNTVIVVEHDEEIMEASDYLIDLGPKAGHLGGKLVFQGGHSQLEKAKDSLTAKYLTGELDLPVPKNRRNWKKFIGIEGASHNNLKNIDVKIPLGVLNVVSGVSGSGKSSLVKSILFPALKKLKEGYSEKTGTFKQLTGDYDAITGVEFVDQNPIGKSSRSNPVTYIKAYDEIRQLFTAQPLSKVRGYKPAFFSFNTDGGRCEMCQGEGTIKVEMQFMADINLTCETCEGKRFKEEVLEVTYHEKSISDVLRMTVAEAVEFFGDKEDRQAKKVAAKIQPLLDVGLGYVQLGQSSSTLSGGEAQRIKLASFIGRKENGDHILFIFDEPTTGLHIHDIQQLLKAFDALLEAGHTLVIIEHNMDVIKCADWITDLGPDGGDAGGNLVVTGTPEDVATSGQGYTSGYLKGKLGI